MFRNFCVASILILSLCSAGAASALPLDPEMAEAAEGPGLLGGLWGKLLAWIEGMAGSEEGNDLTILEMDTCHIDPNGVCGGGS